MFTMKLTGVARLNIMAIMDEKAKGKGYDSDYTTSANLYEKIAISDKQQEEELSVKQNGAVVKQNGIPLLDVEAVRSMPVHDVDLNYEELTKLKNVLKDAEIRPRDRQLWFGAVAAQLEQAAHPPIQDQETRDRQLTEFRSQNRTKGVGRVG